MEKPLVRRWTKNSTHHLHGFSIGFTRGSYLVRSLFYFLCEFYTLHNWKNAGTYYIEIAGQDGRVSARSKNLVQIRLSRFSERCYSSLEFLQTLFSHDDF